MPSTYTTSLRLTLPATGELAGSWGSTVNTGITTLTETAIAGTAAVAMTDANYTLTVANGTTDQARNMFITLSGTLSTTRNVICPSVSKLYVVTNSTTGSQSIVFKTAAGAGITVGNGQRKMLYCDGTNVLDATTGYTSLLFDAGSVSAPSISFVGNTTTGFWLPTTSTVALSTAGSERLRVDSSGNLGIGTSSPAVKLEASTTSAGATVEVLRLSNPGAGANTQAQIKFFTTSTNYGTISGGYGASAPQMTFDLPNGTAGNYVWQISSTERMRLDTAGNLGVGTTSPSTRLDVNGNAQLRASGYLLFLNSDNTNNYYVQNNGATGAANPVLDFVQGGIGTRMRLNASGNLGIGTSSPTSKLHIVGGELAVQSTSGFGATFANTGGIGNYITLSDTGWSSAIGTSNGNLILYTAGNTTERARIDSSGNLGIGTASPARKLDVNGPIRIADSTVLEWGGTSVSINGASSTNTMTFATASTERMRLDSAGNLGVGTAAPSQKVHVYGTDAIVYNQSTGSGATPVAGFSLSRAGASAGLASQSLQFDVGGGGGGADIYSLRESGAGGNLVVRTDNTSGTKVERLRIDTSGNLGLGVTPSAWNASFKSLDFGSIGSLTTNGVASILASNLFVTTGGTTVYKTTAAATYFQQQFGAFTWYTAPSGTAGNAITFTQAMTLDASGNLLVGGTTNPYVAANRGIVQSNGATSALFGLAVGGTAAGYIFSSGSGLSIGAPTGQPILFDINGERARIDSSGNLLVGATAAGTSAAKVIGMGNATAPTTSPAGMGQLYVEGGALKFRGSSGTVTTIAPA